VSISEPRYLVHLQGGLGNLMFQIASMASFAQMTNSTLAFTNFQKQADEYCSIGRTTFLKYPETIFANLNYDINYTSEIQRVYYEEAEYWKELDFLLKEENYYLKGYFQNHNFFNRDFARSIFQFNYVNDYDEYNDLLTKENCLSLHVRRGDYVHIQHELPCQTIEYYQNAVEELGDYEHLFIFSDDQEWCKNNFNFKNSTVVNANEIASMQMMTMCQKHVISNSTFSWWGAYLSNSNDVILPLKWFGPAVTNPRPINHYKLDKWTSI
jgi:hypothetical protein